MGGLAQRADMTRAGIGSNIRRIRLAHGIGQTELVRDVHLLGIPMTRETLVKIEGGRQHIKLEQLTAIRQVLDVSYDELLNSSH